MTVPIRPATAEQPTLDGPEPSDRDAMMTAARLAQERRDWPEAIRLWSVVRARFPDEIDGYLQAAHCYDAAGKPLDVDAMYGLAAERFPHNDQVVAEYAWQAHHRRDWAAATQRWRRLHDLFPNHLTGFLGGAFTLSSAGNAVEADALLERALALLDNPEILLAYARQAHHRGDADNAVRRWAMVRARYPDHARGYIEGAACLRDAGRVEEAEAVLAAAVERFPKDLALAVEAARFAERRGDWDTAIARWAGIRSSLPDADAGYIEGARALLAAGRLDEADALMARAMAAWPENAALACAWADLANRRQAWPEAVDRWRQVRALLPDTPDGYAQGANALNALGRPAEADALLGEGRRNNPDHLGLATTWAELATRRGEWPEAAARWREATERFPQEMRPYLEAARAFAQAGRFPDSDAILESALARFPGAVDVLFTWAHLASRSKPLEEVLSRWDRFRAAFPDHHAGYTAGVWYLHELGRTDDAEALAVEAVQRLPNHAEVLLPWGDAAQRRGDIATAAERFAEAVRRAPDDRQLVRRLARALLLLRQPDAAWDVLERARTRWPDDQEFVRQSIELAQGAGRVEDAYRVWEALVANPVADERLKYELGWYLYQQQLPDDLGRIVLGVLAHEPDTGDQRWLPTVSGIARLAQSHEPLARLAREFLADAPADHFTPAVRAVLQRDLGIGFSDDETRALLRRFVGAARIALTAHLFCFSWIQHDQERLHRTAALFHDFIAEKLAASDWPRPGDEAEILSWMVFAAVFDHATFRALTAAVAERIPLSGEGLATPAEVVSSIVGHAPHLAAPALADVRGRLRIALCVSGQLRGYREAFPTWARLGLDRHDTTIFVDAWRDVGRNWQRIWLFTRPFANLHHMLGGADAAAFLAQRYPALAAAVLASDAEPDELAAFYGTKFVRLENDKDGGFLARPNVWKMHYKIDRAHWFALEDGRDFDLMLRIRPDIAIAADIETDWAELHARSRRERLVFTDAAFRFVYDKFEMGDQFAAGTREVMDVYAGVLSDLDACREGALRPYAIPEALRNHEALGLMSLYRGILAEQLPVMRGTRLLDPTMLSVAEIYALLRQDLAGRELDGLDRDFIEACEREISERKQ